MKYFSTRNKALEFSFKDIFLRGLAPDGGLFLPSEIKRYSQSELKNLSKLSYVDLATEISGVFHIKPNDENLSSLLELYESFYKEPLIVQQYLPKVREGDKRVILVDGKAIGAINRIPADGEARSNMHVGGTPEKCELTKRDLEICETIGPTLKKQGLLFVGIDVIGNHLTEINVTSPTGIQELTRFNGINIAKIIWEAIESKL